jgi:hypothetical protein
MSSYALMKDSSTHECAQDVDFQHTGSIIEHARNVTADGGSPTATAEDVANLTNNGDVRTIYLPSELFTPDETNGPAADTLADGVSATDAVAVNTLAFDNTTDETAWAVFSLPPEWDLGTVKVKILWGVETGITSGKVVEFEVSIGSGVSGDILSDTMGTAVAVVDSVTTTSTTELRLDLTDASSAITVGGSPSAGDILVLKVKRDADYGTGSGTDISADVHFAGILLQYTTTFSTSLAW